METTLDYIKNTYAQEQGYEGWDSIWIDIHDLREVEYIFSKHYDEICIRAQKAALEKAAESLEKSSFRSQSDYISTCTSITNPENLIR